MKKLLLLALSSALFVGVAYAAPEAENGKIATHSATGVKAAPELPGRIERRIEEENSRSYKHHLSPATLGTTYAAYYDNMRRAIERYGTERFPKVAGNKLHGELVLGILVNRDGRVVEVSVERSSGNRLLDRQAEAIVVSAAPFGNFTRAMRRVDLLGATVLFQFADDGTLKTTLLP